MRTSQFLLATVKEVPSDAELISHQLMLRAGLIRKLAAGIYTWLPLGLKVLKNVETIVREEMDKAGALELLMPAIQPAELWQESSRWSAYGPELLRIQDRHERDFCFGPTHEEVITDVMRKELKSYKQLPMTVYQIQTKFRDEIRPRFGVMRAREFMMKDAYSFDIDAAGMAKSYQCMYDAYRNTFNRLGLNYRAVLADTGSIGGNFSHEFQVLAQSGEDLIAISSDSDYAANVELAEALAPVAHETKTQATLEKVSTPGKTTIASVCEFLKLNAKQSIKALVVHGSESKIVVLILRGDHELNSFKAEKLPAVKSPLTFASEQEIQEFIGCKPGYIGPIDLPVPIIVDRDAALLIDFCCGANDDNYHFTGANWGRDVSLGEVHDLRMVVEGDKSPDGKGTLSFIRGIEVGHVFQLGDKYSRGMNATVLDENGKATFPMMGCYGIGVSRIVAAAIEQNHDDRGIIWPAAMAPFSVSLIPINMQKSPALSAAVEKLYQELKQVRITVLFDDRNERPGVMFADHDLIGIPYRIVMGDRGLEKGVVEFKARRDTEAQEIPLDKVIAHLQKLLKSASC